MEKLLKCSDLGMDCDFVVRGKTEEDILKQATEHAKKKHNMKAMPADLLGKVRKAIRTV